MGVDKKSQHVGNHGGVYTDMDGQSKQFTYIDHDVKTKIGVTKPLEELELQDIKTQLAEYRKELQDEILGYPASLCPYVYEDYTDRGESLTTIQWRKSMIEDEGTETEKLRQLAVLIRNRIDIGRLIL